MRLYADEFTDHPMLAVTCHNLTMVVTDSAHEVETMASGGTVRTHRIVRMCRVCCAGVITALVVPVTTTAPTD
jgi:hypothetical protein